MNAESTDWIDDLVRVGFEAARAGKTTDACPWPEGSLGAGAWQVGFAAGDLTRPLSYTVVTRSARAVIRCSALAFGVVESVRDAVGTVRHALAVLRGRA